MLMFGILFFVSAFRKMTESIVSLISWNKESCPFCGSKRSMQIFETSDGYKKVCKKCKFSIEIDDDKSI